MSLLPGQILPQSQPIGKVQPNGDVVIDKIWWLLLYNIVQNSIGTGGSVPDSALEIVEDVAIDAVATDGLQSHRETVNALLQDDATLDSSLTNRDLTNVLLQAQDTPLQDPAPRAQPAQSVTLPGSPFTYTAAFDGTLVVTGGTVSAIALIRQGTSVATGITTGLFPLRRLDQLQITYSVVPTVTFLPS